MTNKQNFATRSDIKKLGKAIETNRKAILAFKGEVGKRFDEQDEKSERMITGFKDEILSHIDPVMKELETEREERTILGHQVDDHEKRISHLETAA